MWKRRQGINGGPYELVCRKTRCGHCLEFVEKRKAPFFSGQKGLEEAECTSRATAIAQEDRDDLSSLA